MFDLSGLGIYLEAGHIVAADWENFRWAEWLLWLSGQRHAAGGVARMSEEGEETGTVTRTLFKDLGLEFNHLCLTDSKVFSEYSHYFAAHRWETPAKPVITICQSPQPSSSLS